MNCWWSRIGAAAEQPLPAYTSIRSRTADSSSGWKRLHESSVLTGRLQKCWIFPERGQEMQWSFCFRKTEYADADYTLLRKPRVSLPCYPRGWNDFK